MIAFSPRLLLEIRLNEPTINDIVEIKEGIEQAKLDEFRQGTIGNTFREIIFGDKKLLIEWQVTKEFSQRVDTIQKMDGYNILAARHKGRELWHLNAHGNQKFQPVTTKRKRHRKQ